MKKTILKSRVSKLLKRFSSTLLRSVVVGSEIMNFQCARVRVNVHRFRFILNLNLRKCTRKTRARNSVVDRRRLFFFFILARNSVAAVFAGGSLFMAVLVTKLLAERGPNGLDVLWERSDEYFIKINVSGKYFRKKKKPYRLCSYYYYFYV